MKKAMDRYNDQVIVSFLAGNLDTTGHTVEVREKLIGHDIIKVLYIDGMA